MRLPPGSWDYFRGLTFEVAQGPGQWSVEQCDAGQWLVSCDDDALAAGANLAAIGSELFQFGDALPLGGGSFRLSRLVRGRGGTEWAASTHAAGEGFVVVDANALSVLELPPWAAGSTVTASANNLSGAVSMAAVPVTGESLRPPSPVALKALSTGVGGLAITWTRRSRAGWSWVDGVDVPLGESRELYRLVLSGSAGSIEIEVDEPEATIEAGELATVGTGAVSIEVRQIGDWAASRPAVLTIAI